MRRPLDYIFLYLKGICIGVTQIMQGISGGSLALLLGVYQEFIFSLRGLDRNAFHFLREKKFSAFWRKINGNFLFIFLAGISTGLLTIRPVLGFLFKQYFIYVSSFFFSLVIIGALLLLRKITRWRVIVAVFLLAGIAISYWITSSTLFTTPDNIFFAFIAGLLAGSTLVIPGVSGSFILMFIGKYHYILASFASLEIGIIAIFMMGGVLGLVFAARFISTTMADNSHATIALLAGLMMGSLNKIWPWREVFEYATTLEGKQVPAFDHSILPWQYMALTGKDPQIFYAVLMMALGVFIAVIIEKIAARLKTKR